MKVYIKFLIHNFLKSFLNVSLIVFCLVIILNLLTEIEFFRNTDVKYYFPLYISILNSPSLVFEMFPFIFLVSTQVLFINLFKNQQIQTFKYNGLKNSKILIILILISFFTGLLLTTLFYNLSSNLKSVYLELKNTYTSDDKYLAVITNNGLWIKDNINKKVNIINASKIDDTYLINASITELDVDFTVIKHIQSEKIDISKKNWKIINPKIYIGNNKSEYNEIKFYSNFDYERIQSLFSNLSSLSIIELFDLKKNYKLLNLSTTEVKIQIHKIFSYPLYLSLMTVLSTIVMFNTKRFNSNTLKISIGLFFSVIIYYINNFFNVMGKTEKIPIVFSIWAPIIFLMIISLIYSKKINEK
jgi:lipopolysaccharide export system permease protein